jgi:hypothetical protein
MASTSRVEIAVEKPRGRLAVGLSRLRLRCGPRQEEPFWDFEGLIWGHDGFVAPVNCTSPEDRHGR